MRRTLAAASALVWAVVSSATIRVYVPPTEGALEAAQQAVREHIRQRPLTDIEVALAPGVHRLAAPLVFGPEDSGEAGRFHVTWAAVEPNATHFDGGAQIPGPWKREDLAVAEDAQQLAESGQGNIWSAPVPPSLLEHASTVRQLYVNGVRYERTRTLSSHLQIPNAAEMTSEGFRLTSLEPLRWKNPTSVEVVSDHTWVQHRCPVTGVTVLHPPPSPPGPPLTNGTCKWSPKTPGHSPGTSLKLLPGSSYASCQHACCEALPKCEAIIYSTESCFLLGRKYEGGFLPSIDSFVADLNCTAHEPPSCPGVPPPVPKPTIVNISAPCFQTAIEPGPLALTLGSVAFFENTGTFTSAAQFYIDIEAGQVLVSHAGEAAPAEVVVGVTQTLMRADSVHDITWKGLSFRHSGWGTPSIEGMVERYGGTLFDLHGSGLHSSPAAVEVTRAHNVQFTNCSFERLGAWGVRLSNGTQSASISRCNFRDLSGGGICIGNVDDTNETRPSLQMAEIVIADSTLSGMGAEYKGAPGIHSYCETAYRM